MKKYLKFFSFGGIGIFLFITGIEVFAKKRTFDFWLKFLVLTFGWVILLYFLPIILVNICIVPLIPQDSILKTICSFAALIYLYIAGVFICQEQITFRDKSGS